MALTSRAVQALRDYRPPRLTPLIQSWADERPRGRARRSSVLVLLYRGARNELRVILTQRAFTMSSFAGDSALPGGRADPGEDHWQTARREAFEEIGLPRDEQSLEQLTVLPPYLASNNLVVVPCVAYVHGGASRLVKQAHLNPDEVAAIFSAPLPRFLSGHAHHAKHVTWFDRDVRIHSFQVGRGSAAPLAAVTSSDTSGPLRGYRVWGLTARILIDVARIAYGKEPEFALEPQQEVGQVEFIEHALNVGWLAKL